MAFLPHPPSIRHGLLTRRPNQLSLHGHPALLIPNVMDFDHPPEPADDYIKTLRGDVGVAAGEYLFLQPTRVVQRKGIEHAIELIYQLGLTTQLSAHLVISHASGDEGNLYEQRLRNYADLLRVPASFIADIIRDTQSWQMGVKYTLGTLTRRQTQTYPRR
jgi:hypothetical protein